MKCMPFMPIIIFIFNCHPYLFMNPFIHEQSSEWTLRKDEMAIFNWDIFTYDK